MAVESGNLRRDLMSKESVLYKNRKGDRLISAILYLLTPFAFMANPLLFVVCITAQLVLQTLHGYRFNTFDCCSPKHKTRYEFDFGINNSNMQSDVVQCNNCICHDTTWKSS